MNTQLDLAMQYLSLFGEEVLDVTMEQDSFQVYQDIKRIEKKVEELKKFAAERVRWKLEDGEMVGDDTSYMMVQTVQKDGKYDADAYLADHPSRKVEFEPYFKIPAPYEMLVTLKREPKGR